LVGRSVLLIARKELHDILHEKTYWLAFFLEIIIVAGVLLLGIALATLMNPTEIASAAPSIPIKVGIVDMSNSSNKEAILTSLEHEDIKILNSRGLDNLRAAVKKGKIMGGIVVPEDYDELANRSLEVLLVLDPSKVFSTVVEEKVRLAVEHASSLVSQERISRICVDVHSFEIEVQSIGEEALPVGSPEFVKAMYLMVIPLVFLFPVFLSANMTSDSIVAEKESGTLGILLATPLSKSEIILGKALPVLAIANVQFLLWIILVEKNVLGKVPIFNKWFLILFLNLATLLFVLVSLLISTRSSSLKEANLYLTVLIMGCILPILIGLPRLGAFSEIVDVLLLSRVIGMTAVSPFLPRTAMALDCAVMAGLLLAIGILCVKSIEGLEPPPSR